ncbi:MAG: hypothetical protein GX932_08605, partial [Methanomicrobiales archaeon]|nr:hypothetical protein [Methanomicrobiales archaeon]
DEGYRYLNPVLAFRGDDIIIQNAKGENRVEITVSFVTGGTFKVKDQIVEVP